MAEEGPEPEATEGPFADSDEWIAAEGRQLFRALCAYDHKAVEIGLFYLNDYLVKTLKAHLRGVPGWDLKRLWFDGLEVPDLDAQPPSTLRITAWLVCVLPTEAEEEWWREPFEFELRLRPDTGQFLGYRFRVGDHRPRDEKRVIGVEIGMSKRIELEPTFRIVDLPYVAPTPVGGWRDEVVRGDFTVDRSGAGEVAVRDRPRD
jgi:hypothetical protein